MLMRLFNNHVLANLTFVLVLVIGAISYNLLPRQQDPTINFNWVVVTTVLPGASSEDIEKRVTDPLEDAIHNVSDIKFASSNSREAVSSLLIRFEDIDERSFDKRVNDLRREIQNVEDELPENTTDPVILEITSANAFPSVTVAVTAQDDDENLRIQARNIEEDLERLAGIDRVDPVGLDDPELQVNFDPEALQALSLSPTALADTVAVWFRDISAGSIDVGGHSWLIRLVGRSANPDQIKQIPLIGQQGEEITLERVAEVLQTREKATQDAVIDGQPAIVLAVMKKANANTLELVERVKTYMDQRNELSQATGVKLVLVDDQTVPTREAIDLMQNNALIGLLLVLLVAWLFLGAHIAFLTAIGIPFILAGTFWVLWGIGDTPQRYGIAGGSDRSRYVGGRCGGGSRSDLPSIADGTADLSGNHGIP
ncbi:MAG: efflux RND transporter permease subunit [Motiliproteus sp.]|nr:efflux RND transporter permease subunit [Motiliproteus sp.]MCW9052945.1 efflux RND transporter permease subunit [Motiliproteus sp.]